jgi:hypothetical protein
VKFHRLLLGNKKVQGISLMVSAAMVAMRWLAQSDQNHQRKTLDFATIAVELTYGTGCHPALLDLILHHFGHVVNRRPGSLQPAVDFAGITLPPCP